MRIVGHGIDIVETARIEKLLNDHRERFLARCFTENEQKLAENHKLGVERLAGRFAAKEAILKAIGTGWRDGIAWTDAEIIRQQSGQPAVVLHGLCKEIAQDMGIDQWLISISHIATHATASAIAIAND